MPINRNPNGRSGIDPAQRAEAKRLGLKAFNVLIDTPPNVPDDPDVPPISFFAYADFIPAIGESIGLQDGQRAVVVDVHHNIINFGETDFFTMVPNVVALLKIKPKKEGE